VLRAGVSNVAVMVLRQHKTSLNRAMYMFYFSNTRFHMFYTHSTFIATYSIFVDLITLNITGTVQMLELLSSLCLFSCRVCCAEYSLQKLVLRHLRSMIFTQSDIINPTLIYRRPCLANPHHPCQKWQAKYFLETRHSLLP
jgi:hypothetical protein